MHLLSGLVLVIYGICLAFIFGYSLVQLHLTILYWLCKRSAQRIKAYPAPDVWPAVTVQLPVYNERYVVERLLDAIAAFDYPRHLLQVQILDDSTDDTTELIQTRLKTYEGSGIDFQHIRRERRSGFKAGALQYGLARATGDFIAIFDADFVPGPDFLKRTIPAFTSTKIGVVQTHWGHLNQNYSLLTRLQAFGLDAHFTVEQSGRNSAGHFINFNGTAGVWRKTCITDAGGWQADTLTEDLDLSYRAQLKNWQFVYLEQVETPSELPVAMGALKSQQFRWAKGAAETARKHLRQVWKSDKPAGTKAHAVFHLLNSGIFICVLVTALLSVPLLYIKAELPDLQFLFKIGAVLLISLLSLSFFYWTALYQKTHDASKTTWQFIPLFLLFLSMSMGLSLHNSLAVLEGYIGKKSPFIRTPKYNIVQAADSWRKQAYFLKSINLLTILEGILAVYFLFGIVAAFELHDFGLLPFHVLLMLGFGSVFLYSVLHSRR
ncbi:cellulose synthase family protein [Pontibacter arcticus]|uniref:Histidine kinase n=1 Tax=Pontibacter arcticus TaxID=2080288 RepID=A0A364RBS4_9BACT|nr:cellulose synthase family protein [Pontibacter arcticus]RAU81743.1 histidine kinase [Pontibacter arcticus]